MKQLLMLLVFALCVLPELGGCREQVSYKNNVGDLSEFPQFPAGTWKADKDGWELVFEPNGTISSAVIPLGRVRIRPNQTTKIQGRLGEPGIFEAGDCVLEYGPESGKISITIDMKHIYAEISGGILDGTCEYFITGSIQKDRKTWEATVFSVLDLDVLKPDPNSASALPETIYLVMILDEYYPVVSVSEDRKSVQISNWNDPESFPGEPLEVQTARHC